MVVPDNGAVVVDEYFASARIETPHSVHTFDNDEQRVTFIAGMSTSQFPPIPAIGEWCEENKIYRYGTDKAKCLQGHNRMHYPIEQTPALWLIIPTIVGYPVWQQPTGAHDAYQIGDIVWYPDTNGQLWISKINANVTVPDGDVPYNRYWAPYND
jgi:hypothetical protein